MNLMDIGPVPKGPFLISLLRFIGKSSMTMHYMRPSVFDSAQKRHPAQRCGRFLSMFLRHRADEFDITPDPEGYVDMVGLLKLHAFQMHAKTSAFLHYVVEQNPKGRFDFKVADPSVLSLSHVF